MTVIDPKIDAAATLSSKRLVNDNTSQSRRQFLQTMAVGASAFITAKAVANPLDAIGKASTNTHPNTEIALRTLTADLTRGLDKSSTHCVPATISTRLFASSNGAGDRERNELSLKRLNCAGFAIDNPDIVHREYLRFAGTDAQRASDLQNIATGAIAAPKLLLGVRGGYGAMRLLPLIDWTSLGQIMQEQGSIMAGFSDVTAVQCALLAKGSMSSLAAPMLYSEFGKTNPDQISCQHFVEALTNPKLQIEVAVDHAAQAKSPIITQPKSLTNNVTGIIWGGNLSVVSALAGSDYLPQPKGGIVFLEDTGEQPYRVERMLYSLYLAGAFKHQQAIVLGAFSGTGEDSYDDRYDMSQVIAQLQRITQLPVLTGLPFGHVARKHSFPLGAECTLAPTSQGYRISFDNYPVLDAQKINPQGLWQ